MSKPLPEPEAPHSLSPEETLLEAILLDPTRLEDVPLEARDFYAARYKAIYKAIVEREDTGRYLASMCEQATMLASEAERRASETERRASYDVQPKDDIPF